MATTAEQMRAWRGPVLLTYGFRPFFLAAGLWAALAMVIWIAVISGQMDLPSAFDPVSWHAHEFLFGYLGAVVSGFLLTAVPNWTGRLPIVGWPLAGLAGLWLAGRVAVMFSAHLPPLTVAVIDLSELTALAGFLLREIITGRNWRNLVVVAMLGALILANGWFHYMAAVGDYPAHGPALRLALAAAIMLVALIGGRIIPSFTRNWLVRRGDAARPATPGRFDQLTLGATLVALALWVWTPETVPTGVALILCGLLQAARLARWSGLRTFAEPLVWILHVAYAFVPLGAVALGAVALYPDQMVGVAAQHLWMAGAIGIMTLAVMTRATLGHTGQELSASSGTVAVYLAVLLSVVCRFAAGILTDWSVGLIDAAGALWIAGFVGFALIYGPALLRPKPAQ